MPNLPTVKYLLFDVAVQRKIREFVTDKGHALEQGGILLGFRKARAIHVVAATFPGLNDRSSPTRFVRCDPSHQETATKMWNSSTYTIDWVGEWHTHPESQPSPSSIDRRSWRRQSIDRNAPMAYIIFGFDQTWTGIQTVTSNGTLRLTYMGSNDRQALYSRTNPQQETTKLY